MLKVINGYSFCANLETVSDQRLQTAVLFHQSQHNAMLMTVSAGHTIHDHVSPKMPSLQIIAGTGQAIVDDGTHRVRQGAWLYIEPDVPHEVISDETLIIILNMVAAPLSGVFSNE